MNFVKTIILCFALIIVKQSISQEYDIKQFTTKQGLPHNYINDIYQDSDGFIWLATRNGVCKYDGYKFEVYSTILEDKSRIPTFSQNIFEDKEGKIWVFGPGLFSYYYNYNRFSAYSDDYVLAYPDKKGGIWFVTDSTLIRFELQTAHIAKDLNHETNNLLRLICKERNDKVWAFRNFTYQELINSSKGFYDIYRFNKNYYINNVFVDSDSDIWVSTNNNGLLKLEVEKKSFKYFNDSSSSNHGLSDNHVYAVSEFDNEIWIGTMKGINILNQENNQIRYIVNNQYSTSSISDDAVTCFLKDRTGAIFIGTRYGLNIAQKRMFKHYYKVDGKNSVVNNNIHGFIEDDQKNIWIISTGGLDKFDPNKEMFKNYSVNKTPSGGLNASPISIISDEKQNFWIGTWQGGLFYYNKKTDKYTNYKTSDAGNTISHNSIMSLFHDSKNGIWIGSWGGGLNFYNSKTKEFYSYKNDRNDKNSLSDNEVSAFAEDYYGRMWIGTTDGLNLLIDKGKGIFKRFENNVLDSTSLSNNQINALYVKNNILWIGTSTGLNRMNLNDFSIIKISTADGLPSNNIKAIICDDQNNLWVSTNKGLAKIELNIKKEFEVNQIVNFYTSDGLQDEEFLERAVLKISNGELLFGGTNGFNKFKPNEISSDTITPRSIFTKLLVDNKEISVKDILHGNTILSQPISQTKKIALSYKHKAFSFEFSGLHFSEPNAVTYRYMLEGFDKEWKVVDAKQRIATYTNIDKGVYKFILNASNRDKLWGKPISMEIEVIPPFWSTTWFMILFYFLVAVGIYMLIELRIRIIKKQKRNLENIVEIRTSEIREQKDSIQEQKEEIDKQASQIKAMNEILKQHNFELKDNLESLSKARVMQKLLDYDEFKKIFKNEEACGTYLIELKWGKGFHCARCNSSDFSEEDDNSRRCRKCNYKESLTSGTIFHHLRFPIDKALYILIVTSTGRKINISELSRKLDLRLKTVWNFHNKVKEELSYLKSPIKSNEGWTSLIITPKKRKYK